ncbi:hypothetical protein COU23_01905 [Candidatus Kuenenbacteria bacterium CG10_big_fil_rev_8_21_14_0_10_36_11]|uniref:Uncharacterized protein n=1 Tax=Candidatus Kuenenbacteria bacterium CG10_big_fil_rev_8_21_14_0_10_36_11 TaxID=1974618 RepID=A0A2M6WAL4_9BACT|nr:MAG: hypothetical protein COU23_01905 [Candidatus Kuenenbacteria bacterium CG10_big_fil_rev_8_21_14_0_10_36_11]
MEKSMNQKNKEIIQHSLKLIKHCPVCANKYEDSQLRVLDWVDNGVLIYFMCKYCQSSLLAQISEMPFGVVGSAMLTDLSVSEVIKFRNANAITVDDVLEVYEKLEGSKTMSS